MGNSNQNTNTMERIWTLSKQSGVGRTLTSGEYSTAGGRTIFLPKNTIWKYNLFDRAVLAFLQ
eukprot:7632374-Ditylum_brightwellii.AAC.1